MKEQNFFTHFDDSKTKVQNNDTKEKLELEEELHEIEKNIEQLETVKASLQLRRIKLEKKILMLPNEETNINQLFECCVISHMDATLLTITMPFRLPIYKKITGKKYDYYKTLNHTYMIPMVEKLNSIQMLPKFEKVFVLITHYTSTEVILDTDNRFHSFIFNALRSTKVIVDDNHSRLNYMENGAVIDGVEAVRVVVCDIENLLKALDYNNLCIKNLPIVNWG
ncbi:hypothetical protein ACMGD3_24140 [Lysinibacillus sphaericus]|uniref:hypothetical protein n=1 Tax=Lysinibacillus sphaericus TaxID=1421 RepID=UPI003F7B1AED